MKVILYMGMSINGFVARQNDETPWSDEEWEGFQNMCRQCGNIILGHRTFELAVKDGDFPFEGALNVVCTSKNMENQWGENAAFVKKRRKRLLISYKAKVLQ